MFTKWIKEQFLIEQIHVSVLLRFDVILYLIRNTTLPCPYYSVVLVLALQYLLSNYCKSCEIIVRYVARPRASWGFGALFLDRDLCSGLDPA